MSFNERIWYRDCYTEIWREDCLVYYISPTVICYIHPAKMFLLARGFSIYSTPYITYDMSIYIYVVWVSDIMTWDIFLSITDADMNSITQYNYLYLRCPLIKWCVFEVRPTNFFRLILYYEGSCTMYFVSCTFSI